MDSVTYGAARFDNTSAVSGNSTHGHQMQQHLSQICTFNYMRRIHAPADGLLVLLLEDFVARPLPFHLCCFPHLVRFRSSNLPRCCLHRYIHFYVADGLSEGPDSMESPRPRPRTKRSSIESAGSTGNPKRSFLVRAFFYLSSADESSHESEDRWALRFSHCVRQRPMFHRCFLDPSKAFR